MYMYATKAVMFCKGAGHTSVRPKSLLNKLNISIALLYDLAVLGASEWFNRKYISGPKLSRGTPQECLMEFDLL
jgi:hypothetical protein